MYEMRYAQYTTNWKQKPDLFFGLLSKEGMSVSSLALIVGDSSSVEN